MSVVVCAYYRSAFTLANKGELAVVRPDDLAAQLVDGVLSRTNIKAEAIEDLLCGCAFPEGEQGFNIGRQIVFLSSLGNETCGATINRWCGSSMEAIHCAAAKIAFGAAKVVLVVGVESMTRVPIGGFNPMPNPALYEIYPQAYMNMGETAEEVAKREGVSREEMENFALNSHKKAVAADFGNEIIAINTEWEVGKAAANGKVVDKDGCIRADSTLEQMAELKPAFRADGVVTAATSSPLTDGAAAVLIADEQAADELSLPKLARIKSFAVAGLDPEIMGLGPVPASEAALSKAGLQVQDIDIWEINEAFASQAIAVANKLNIDMAKLNIEGGAIALGHPLGASGARITGKAAQLLSKTGGKYALASMCIGGGMGITTILESV